MKANKTDHWFKVGFQQLIIGVPKEYIHISNHEVHYLKIGLVKIFVYLAQTYYGNAS